MKSRSIVVVAALALLLSGCASKPQVERLAPSPAPPLATVDGTEVPSQSAGIQPVRDAVPPVRVQIIGSNVDIPVEPVGVQDDGLMQLPKDIRTAGWYRYGPDPESPLGSTVISAHVDSFDQGIGPFAYLKEVSPGAEVVVTTADGTDHRYTVESVGKVSKEELPIDQIFDRAGLPRLVLITCGGQFDRNILNYTDNVVLIANPVA